MTSIFGIHTRFIEDAESRRAGLPTPPADRQIGRTRVIHDELGRVARVEKVLESTVSPTIMSYDDRGRIVETWNPQTRTRVNIVYDGDLVVDVIRTRVA